MPSGAPVSPSAIARVFVEWIVGKKHSLPAKGVAASAPSSAATSKPVSNACADIRLVDLRRDAHAEVDSHGGMRQCAYGNVIHARLRIFADVVEHNAARSFNRNLPTAFAHDAHCLLHLRR